MTPRDKWATRGGYWQVLRGTPSTFAPEADRHWLGLGQIPSREQSRVHTLPSHAENAQSLGLVQLAPTSPKPLGEHRPMLWFAISPSAAQPNP